MNSTGGLHLCSVRLCSPHQLIFPDFGVSDKRILCLRGKGQHREAQVECGLRLPSRFHAEEMPDEEIPLANSPRNALCPPAEPP